MGFFSNLLGTTRPADREPAATDDELAVQRYEHLLRTASPETVEQVHTEAFGRLTEEQRDLLFRKLTDGAPTPDDRPADALPATLAKTATRAEAAERGSLPRILGGQQTRGTDGIFGGSLLNAIAAYAIVSAVADGIFLASAFGQPPLDDNEQNPDAGGFDAPIDGSFSAGDAGWGGFGL
jgi:hypothetical protein